MIIDLGEWNEYIADDVPPGPIPQGIEVEVMQIVTSNCFRDAAQDDFPTGLRLMNAIEDPPRVRLYWRMKTIFTTNE